MNTYLLDIRIRRGLVAFAALGGIALTTAATAGELSNEPLTKAVSYADLNLNNQAGAERMYRRLRGAAYEVCAPLEGRRGSKTPWRECVDRAVASAVERVNEPALTEHHLAKQRKVDTRVASTKR